VLIVVLCVAAVARLWGILDESPWNDEVLTLKHIGLPTQAEYLKAAFEEDPWLILSQGYYRVQYAWRSVFGPSVLSIRLLSVALSLASLPLIALMGHRLFGARAGIAAAALCALSLVQVYFAQETRFYALLYLEAGVAMLGLLLALQGRRTAWLLHGAGNAALLVTHAFTPLLFAAQGVFLLWHWRARPALIALWAAAHFAMLGVSFLWTQYGLRYDFADKTQAYNDVLPGWRELVMSYVVFAGGRVSNHAPGPYMPGGVSLDWGVTLLVAGLAAGCVAWCLRGGMSNASTWNRRDSAVFLLAWLVIPVVLLFAASHLWKPVFQYRYVLYAAAPLMLLAGGGLAAIPAKKLRVVVAMLLAGMMAWQTFALERPLRPAFNAFAIVVNNFPPPDGVLSLKPFVGRAAQFALGPEREVTVLYGLDDLLHETDLRLKDGGGLWAVFHQWSDFERLESALDGRGYYFEPWQLYGIPPLHAYRIVPKRAWESESR